MGLYAKFVLPLLIDVAMKNKETTRLRAAWIPHARGDVLEVGIGSGLNLPYYSPEVRHVWGVDPSAGLQQMAAKRAAAGRVPVEFLSQSAEEPLPLASRSVDTAVVTWALCSIPNASLALQHVRRVLKSGGRLIFLEHGRAPDARVVAWQDRLTPLWKSFTGGCHLNRKIDELLTASGFQITELRNFYLPGPRPMTYTYQGVAQPT
ncbi:MAG TPA: class I SAM-dependent methyltransferase [Candidatus Acidoferrales bacterium]|nr:class I SAM-dependent methyltransferase [Candidatus Acidoferrales bacterium]